MKSKVDLAVETLKGHGHSVRPYRHEDQVWYEVDGILNTSQEEMGKLADRLQLLLNAEDTFVHKRKAKMNN
jgi:hypothetical protein